MIQVTFVVFALGVCLAAVLRAVLPNGSVGLLHQAM